MIELTDIKKAIGPDLVALNRIIEDTLHSESKLMESIVTKYLRVKGKQLRPILVLLSGRFFGGITDKVLNAGAAIEMLHNASLIHDDVIDRSKERRGIATINSMWDNHVAVLVGDFFVSGALACANRTGEMRILNAMSHLGSDLALGEIDQFENARERNINENEYFDIIRNKTASLFKCCVEVGGYAANADAAALSDLTHYAELLGICFQIKDDTFDYYNDPVIGKPTGNDLREGKITLPLIHALAKTELKEHDEMVALAHKEQLTTDEIERLVAFAKDNGGIEYAYSTMERLRDDGNAIIDKYEPNDTIDSFKLIFQYIIDRKK
jgi:octaprenyl-diphosphate synthase